MDGGWFSINFSKRATGHCSGFSGVAHIFGRKGRQPPACPFLVLVSRLLNTTYFRPLLSDWMLKSPNVSLWCSSLPRIPMCMVRRNHIVCWRFSAEQEPKASQSQSFLISSYSSASAALALFPFPSFFSCFRMALTFRLKKQTGRLEWCCSFCGGIWWGVCQGYFEATLWYLACMLHRYFFALCSSSVPGVGSIRLVGSSIGLVSPTNFDHSYHFFTSYFVFFSFFVLPRSVPVLHRLGLLGYVVLEQ